MFRGRCGSRSQRTRAVTLERCLSLASCPGRPSPLRSRAFRERAVGHRKRREGGIGTAEVDQTLLLSVSPNPGPIPVMFLPAVFPTRLIYGRISSRSVGEKVAQNPESAYCGVHGWIKSLVRERTASPSAHWLGYTLSVQFTGTENKPTPDFLPVCPLGHRKWQWNPHMFPVCAEGYVFRWQNSSGCDQR